MEWRNDPPALKKQNMASREKNLQPIAAIISQPAMYDDVKLIISGYLRDISEIEASQVYGCSFTIQWGDNPMYCTNIYIYIYYL